MKINSIVFSGGGMKGVSFLGVLKRLQEQNLLKDIKDYYGTSIGGLICLCMILNFTFEELTEFFHLHLKSIKPCMNISNLIKEYGADNGDKLQLLISRILNFKLFSIKTTFKELHLKTEKQLNVFAVDLKDQNVVHFSHLNTPDFLVLDAVKASMSLPIIFKPVLNRYIDGALLCNFPKDFSQNEASTFCFNITSEPQEISSLFNYITNIFSCIINYQLVQRKRNCERNVFNLDVNIDSLDFNLSKETILEIINIGYEIKIDLEFF